MFEYAIHLAILICIYIIFAQGLNVTFGMGRAFNLAHSASYAVGAYTTALLATQAGYHFLGCIALSMLLSGLFAFLIGAIALRLTEEYFAIGTLAFSSVVSALLINWKSLTRGVLGIPGIPRPEFLNIDFYNNQNFLCLAVILVVLVQIALYPVFHGACARRLKAQSEFRAAALALGLNAKLLQNLSFLAASALAGLAGSLFAFYINYIDPTSFTLVEVIFVLTIVVLGKPGSYWGVVLAAAFLVLLPEPLRFLKIDPEILGPMRQLLYALILFAVVSVNRDRLFPSQRRI